MKIAIATDNQRVSGHFGHCEGFTIYEVEEGKVLKNEFIENPGHRPGFLPVFLRDNGVDAIIAGGMGASAQQLFNHNDIDVIVGVRGQLDRAINDYLRNDLQSTGSICREHQHHGHCND